MNVRSKCLFAALLLFRSASPAPAEFDKLSSLTPEGANIAVAIDAAALKETPLAQKRQWTQKLDKAYVDREIVLPPQAARVLVAGQLAPEEQLELTWQATLFELTQSFSMPGIARAEGGYVDEIAGKQTVFSPSGSYLVQLGDRQLGILSPASRQSVSRWLSSLSSKSTSQLSPYLAAAIGAAGSSSQIVLAIDLDGAVSPHRVQKRLEGWEVLENSGVSVDELSTLLLSLEGAVMEISVDTGVKAKTQISFSRDVTLSPAFAKKLLLEAMRERGVELTDLAEHKCTIAGKSIFLTGELTSGGLRRVLSLLSVPSPPVDATPTSDDTKSDKGVAEKSAAYYHSVMALVDDLQADKTKQAAYGGSESVWFERYGQKIDRLPILHVDPELIDWGSKVAGTLREMAGARKTAGLAAGVEASSLRSGYQYDSNGYYYYQGNTELDRTRIRREHLNESSAKRIQGFQLINDAAAQIRKTMTERYQIEF